MTDIMVDIETLSTCNNAVILTIGAVKFNRNRKTKSLEESFTFYRRINIDSCLEAGLVSSQDTLNWWNSQKEEIRHEVFENTDRVDLRQALEDFSHYFIGSKYIWSHGDDFDCVILNSAYKALDMTPPWKFWNTRDTRTIFDIAKIRLDSFENNNLHHSLHDAYNQVKCLELAFSLIYIKRQKS